MEENVRLNINVSEDLIDSLKKETSTKTNQKLIDDALWLLKWAVQQKKEGRNIGSIHIINPMLSYRELIMPCLEKIES